MKIITATNVKSGGHVGHSGNYRHSGYIYFMLMVTTKNNIIKLCAIIVYKYLVKIPFKVRTTKERQLHTKHCI